MTTIKDLHKKWITDADYRQEYEALAVDGIKRGIADMKAGRVVPHDEAMREIREAIKEAIDKKP